MTAAHKVLLALFLAAFLTPLGLIAAYIWQAGLDLHQPTDAREWIKVCARSREDMYCKAAVRVLRGTSGPVVFLHPNKGNREIGDDLRRWKGRPPTATELEAVARANLFAAPAFRAGVMVSLDGQPRQVRIGLPNQRGAGQIGHLRFGLPVKSARVAQREGTVSLVLDPAQKQDFFLPAP